MSNIRPQMLSIHTRPTLEVIRHATPDAADIPLPFWEPDHPLHGLAALMANGELVASHAFDVRKDLYCRMAAIPHIMSVLMTPHLHYDYKVSAGAFLLSQWCTRIVVDGRTIWEDLDEQDT